MQNANSVSIHQVVKSMSSASVQLSVSFMRKCFKRVLNRFYFMILLQICQCQCWVLKCRHNIGLIDLDLDVLTIFVQIEERKIITFIKSVQCLLSIDVPSPEITHVYLSGYWIDACTARNDCDARDEWYVGEPIGWLYHTY